MTQSMELTEKVERIRDLTALDAAEELVRLPADDIQFGQYCRALWNGGQHR